MPGFWQAGPPPLQSGPCDGAGGEQACCGLVPPSGQTRGGQSSQTAICIINRINYQNIS
jgi:hypothetical protein